MKCKNCGFEFPQGKFCPKCGNPVDDIADSSANTDNTVSKETEEEKKQEHFASKKTELDAEKAKQEVEIEKQKTEQAKIGNEVKINQMRTEQEQKNESEKINKSSDTFAVISLVCGIVSLCTLGCFYIPEILGIIFSFRGKRDGKMLPKAKAGLICSILSIVVMVVIIIVATFAG